MCPQADVFLMVMAAVFLFGIGVGLVAGWYTR